MMKFETKHFKNYDIVPWLDGHITLEVTHDNWDGETTYVFLNAVEVYNNLKRYFKDTEYE